jgi:hypothetical protein
VQRVLLHFTTEEAAEPRSATEEGPTAAHKERRTRRAKRQQPSLLRGAQWLSIVLRGERHSWANRTEKARTAQRSCHRSSRDWDALWLAGRPRMEGKDYAVWDGNVLLFHFNV